MRLETKYMRETVFWTTFDGVNRHSSYGDRVTKVETGHSSYLLLLGQGATFEEENDDYTESHLLISHHEMVTNENPEADLY